ncbi:MAG: hypothetical protein H7833_11865 [Magnetococcus sp. DMHC-1]
MPHELLQSVEPMTDTEIESSITADPDTFMPEVHWFANARLVAPRTREIVTLRLDPEFTAGERIFHPVAKITIKA